MWIHKNFKKGVKNFILKKSSQWKFRLLTNIIILTGVNISCVVVGWNCCSMDFPYAFTACLNCKLFTKANTVNTYRQPPYAVVHVDRFKSIRRRINCIHVNECFIETVGVAVIKWIRFLNNISFNMYTQHYHSILVFMKILSLFRAVQKGITKAIHFFLSFHFVYHNSLL